MTHYGAESIKRTERDLVLLNDDGVVIKTVATFWCNSGLCTKVAMMLNALPEIVAALEAIKASNGYGCKVPDDYDDSHTWLVEAGAIRKVAKALAKVREVT